MTPLRTAEILLQEVLPLWRAELPTALAGDTLDAYLREQRAGVLKHLEAWLRENGDREDAAVRPPLWRSAATIPRRQGTQGLRTEAEAILAAVRAYLSDPDWPILDDEERTEIIHTGVVPLWEMDDADRLVEAVTDVDGGLREEGDVIEEIAAALRDGTDPELEIHTVHPDVACEFVRVHHRHLPECNRRGIVHALAARWRGQIVAVALAGSPTGRWGRDAACSPEGSLEITRVASKAGLRRYDRRGRLVPVGAASALVARLIDLLPESGRGVPGCRLITYQLTSEDGAIYRALVAKGLRPVARSHHHQAGGTRSRVALAGAKIRWEAGPAAGTPDWTLLQPQHQPGARAAFEAFERQHERGGREWANRHGRSRTRTSPSEPPTARAMASARTRRPSITPSGFDAFAVEMERRVKEKERDLAATMDRLVQIYSGGRLAGRRIRPGTIVVERVNERPEFPTLVLPGLASIADGFDVGAAVAIVGVMPSEVELAGWVEADDSTREGDRLMARLEALITAYQKGQLAQSEFEAARNELWKRAEATGVAVEMAWRLRKIWGPSGREPAVTEALAPIRVRIMPQQRYLLELYLRQIPQDARTSVISQHVRPPYDHIELGKGAWQGVVELVANNSTCTRCPFVLGSNLDCGTCRAWILSLKKPGPIWSADRLQVAIRSDCPSSEVAGAAALAALAKATESPLTPAFFSEFAESFAEGMRDWSDDELDHCRESVEYQFVKPDFPLYPEMQEAVP